MNTLEEICIDLDRYYYYGRQDAVATQMAKLRAHLAATSRSKVTGDIDEGNATGSRA